MSPIKTLAVNSSMAPRPDGQYTQALEVQGLTRLLFVSGQIPASRDGTVPEGFLEQAELVWANLTAQLEAAGMSVANLVKVTTFLSSRDFSDINGEVRRRVLGNHAPALTVVIAGIFDASWLLEIEAIAAA
ncbi:RidA family protein [Roseateles sp. NT4]|uniref:RidA family protein n=1 Tax=Roseateles sp. NT4 TaxID=3453715 RepID=UPI003EE8E82E